MTTEANKEIVRRWFDEVIGQRQIDLIDEICAPEVVNWAAVPERRYGIEGMKDIARFIFDVQPDQHWPERRLIAEDDFVVAYGIRAATWQGGSFRGIATPDTNGKQIAVELAHMFRFKDGKIAEHWAVRDDLGMMQQLGVLPQP